MDLNREGIRVLHVVGGLASQGGVMAFAEMMARSSMDGVEQAIWKHRDYSGSEGIRWVCEGVARATDMGMRHDLLAGLREARRLSCWLRERAGGGERWILHAHSRVGAIAVSLAGRVGGVRPIVHLHKLSGQPWIYRGLVRWAGAAWVFNSQRTRRHHGVGEGEATVVYPPVRWPGNPAREEGPGRLMAAGAFVRVKQFDRLIGAMSVLRTQGVDWPLAIYGRSDPAVDPVHDRELAALAGGVPGVTLCRYRSAWADELGGSDVFVHPADREAYGIVILEAFARGCRVVVPPESVLSEWEGGWEGSAGVTVAESTKPEGLARAIRKAWGETGTVTERWRLRRVAARRVSVEECVCQLGRMYRSLSDTNRCFRNSSKP